MAKPTPIDEPLLRGVNLGGWLVLEKWMNKSLFAGTKAHDEYGFMQTPGAQAKIEHHRQTFITEADFKWMRDNGLNAVRIPVGYWLLEDDGPFLASYKYLDWAVSMSAKYDLRVLIDLHAAPGSQNGNDHSGRIGSADWYARSDYRRKTIDILGQIAERYYDSPAVWGIELLNEPKWGIFQFKLRRFYKKAYQRLCQTARPGTHVVFSDGFTPRLMSGALKANPNFPVVMDVHWYQFTANRQLPLNKYLAQVRRRAGLIRRWQRQQPVIIGEWSMILSHGILEGRSLQDKTAIRMTHAKLQQEAYQSAAGWFYWNYKTEERGGWNLRSLVEDGKMKISKPTKSD